MAPVFGCAVAPVRAPAPWLQLLLPPQARCRSSRLRPLGRHAASGSEHADALAAALWEAPRCNEVGAGPYCIAQPRGVGALADAAPHSELGVAMP